MPLIVGALSLSVALMIISSELAAAIVLAIVYLAIPNNLLSRLDANSFIAGACVGCASVLMLLILTFNEINI